MQKLGQHFLKNVAVLGKIVGALAIANDDRIIEIGPGHGELTMPLAQASRDKHCKIFCIEKDHALIDGLKALAARESSAASGESGDDAHINIIEGDALKLLPEIISTEIDVAAKPHYKIVGNIPYYITGKLLRVVSELEYKPERVVLLIQKEVAERICAEPPAMNRLAASVQFWADAEIIAQVPRKDFSPPPEVDSAVVLLKTKNLTEKSQSVADRALAVPSSIDPVLYYRAVRGIFAQPRKTLLNNLSMMACKDIKKADISAQLKKIGVGPEARPQDLGIEQIAAIVRMDLWE